MMGLELVVGRRKGGEEAIGLGAKRPEGGGDLRSPRGIGVRPTFEVKGIFQSVMQPSDTAMGQWDPIRSLGTGQVGMTSSKRC
jgi:hypothetical protein